MSMGRMEMKTERKECIICGDPEGEFLALSGKWVCANEHDTRLARQPRTVMAGIVGKTWQQTEKFRRKNGKKQTKFGDWCVDTC